MEMESINESVPQMEPHLKKREEGDETPQYSFENCLFGINVKKESLSKREMMCVQNTLYPKDQNLRSLRLDKVPLYPLKVGILNISIAPKIARQQQHPPLFKNLENFVAHPHTHFEQIAA